MKNITRTVTVVKVKVKAYDPENDSLVEPVVMVLPVRGKIQKPVEDAVKELGYQFICIINEEQVTRKCTVDLLTFYTMSERVGVTEEEKVDE